MKTFYFHSSNLSVFADDVVNVDRSGERGIAPPRSLNDSILIRRKRARFSSTGEKKPQFWGDGLSTEGGFTENGVNKLFFSNTKYDDGLMDDIRKVLLYE